MFLLITYEVNNAITTIGNDFDDVEYSKLPKVEFDNVIEEYANNHFKSHRKLFKGSIVEKVSNVTYSIV